MSWALGLPSPPFPVVLLDSYGSDLIVVSLIELGVRVISRQPVWLSC
jgi:hypothetical protein